MKVPEGRNNFAGSGGPGAIRTPDPQIRSLVETNENKGFFCKPALDSGLSVQGLRKSVQTSFLPLENENPGALAGATGANSSDLATTKSEYAGSNHDAIWKHLTERHRRAARMLGCGLILNDGRAWAEASAVWAMRLEEKEIAGIAYAALTALHPDMRETIFHAAHWGEVSGAGAPIPPLLNDMDEARSWANLASRSELKAYCFAAFEAMPRTDQLAFLRHVRKEAV